MLVLALDTTTRGGSVAVARDGRVLDLLEGDAARPHAERLPGDLVTSLERAGASLADVDVFAVAVGPGSFTGLRIGIAAIQGCAFAAGRPVVGVSALEALALAAAGGASDRRRPGASASGSTPSGTRCSPRSTTSAARALTRHSSRWKGRLSATRRRPRGGGTGCWAAPGARLQATAPCATGTSSRMPPARRCG